MKIHSKNNQHNTTTTMSEIKNTNSNLESMQMQQIPHIQTLITDSDHQR